MSESIKVTVNGESLPVELTTLIASVFSTKTVDMTGDVRTVTNKIRGENIKAMQASKPFVQWLESLGDTSLDVEVETDDEKAKIYHVFAKNFIPFCKEWAIRIAAMDAIKTLVTVEYVGEWGKRGRQAAQYNPADVLTAGLDKLGK